ncbi:hypothetical protein G6514_005734 [Epicoccum nigrum]|nr:hypothetical protein G6514_005734 [Epicoccum nigrum]
MSSMSSSYRGRGGYAPRRGRGGGWSQPFAKRQDSIKPDLQKHPLGDLIFTVQKSDLRSPRLDLTASLHIQGCEYVTSYNWLASKDPTVVVPGQPPQWTPPKISQRLQEDSGSYYRDPNAAQYPDYPLAPAVKATLDSIGNKPINTDIFACGSTLGNLLRFTRGTDRAFRLSVQAVGKTVFLIRKENDPKELIDGVRGFGHSFPDAYTSWPSEVKGSKTHQRLVQYELGGLKCLVRFECDGFLDTPAQPSTPIFSVTKNVFSQMSQETPAEALPSTTASTPHVSGAGSFSVVQAGKSVPQASIFDLKTRSGRYKKEINMNDITPVLWLKQIPNFIVAYHDGSGLFQDEDIHIEDVRPLTTDFEKNNSEAIHSLVALLQKIADLAKEDDRGLLEVYCSGNDVLEIRKQFGQGVQALPVSLRDQWEKKCDSGGLTLGVADTGHEAFLDDPSQCLYDLASDESDAGDKDFTACSADGCGYCGRCTY